MTVFTQHGADRGMGRATHATALLPGGQYLSVVATAYARRVELALTGGASHCVLAFDAGQARDVAAELLAAAAALEERLGDQP